jgi:hypothetical protein
VAIAARTIIIPKEDKIIMRTKLSFYDSSLGWSSRISGEGGIGAGLAT